MHKINIRKKQGSNCARLAFFFISKTDGEASELNEIRVTFDRYALKSLNSNTRINRTGGVSSNHHEVLRTLQLRP